MVAEYEATVADVDAKVASLIQGFVPQSAEYEADVPDSDSN